MIGLYSQQKPIRVLEGLNYKANNVQGDVVVANAWTPLGITAFIVNQVDAVITTNRFELKGGKYIFNAKGIFGVSNFGTNAAKIRLYNVTDSVVVRVGDSSFLATANNGNISSEIKNYFLQISSAKNYELQYFVNGITRAYPVNSGNDEIYASINVFKID